MPEGTQTVTTLSLPRPTAPAIDSAVWQFDDFVLDLPRYELRRNGTVIRVEPQVFDVLTLLVKHHDRVVTKTELFDSVWGGRFVGDAALSSRIKAIRQALDDSGQLQHTIRTVRGRGYQFVGNLRGSEADVSEGGRLRSLGAFPGTGSVRHLRPGPSHGHNRTRYRLAPSTRRREFSGPPR
jgi:DNA-binding winged helix-turn-helix (wHTH) protein